MKGLSDQFKGHVANGVSFPKSILPWWHWCEVIICSLGCLKCSSGWICTHTYIYKYVYIYTHLIHILCLCILHICTYFHIYIYYTHNICSIHNILQKSLNNFFLPIQYFHVTIQMIPPVSHKIFLLSIYFIPTKVSTICQHHQSIIFLI